MNWAVLGLVIERPSYGYELFQRLGRRYGGVLEPHVSQIYAALDALERAGLIEVMVGDHGTDTDGVVAPRTSARRQPKVRYRATAAGGTAFRGWVAERMRSDAGQEELLRRLAAAAGAVFDGVGVMRALVDDYERQCLEEAARMPLPPARYATTTAAAAGELAERLVLAARRGLLDAQFKFIDYARKEIDGFVGAGFARGRT